MISSMASKLKNGDLNNAPPPTEATPPESAGPTQESAQSVEAGASAQKLPDMLTTLAPLLSSELAKGSRQNDDRTCLLRALKPYLSAGRSEAVEYIIKISRLTDILKNLS